MELNYHGKNLGVPNEDPYKTFRRSLIQGQRGGTSPRGAGTAATGDRMVTKMSRESNRSRQAAAEAYELS